MALVPTSSAQQNVTGSLTCDPGPEEIRPLGPPGQWQCTAEVEWSGGTSEPVNPTSLTINTANQKSWMNVIISPSSMTFTPPQGDTRTETKDFTVSVSLRQDAPAFVATQLRLVPDLQPGTGEGQEAVTNPTQIAVTPGYFNLYNVRLDGKIAEGGPDSEVTFPMVIENFSNGDTRFEFSVAQEGGTPEGFQTALPSPLTVRSQATGGENTQGQATFQVFTPFKNGYVNRIASIQLTVDSFYAADTSIEGASSQISTLTKTKGFYVPGPGPALTALGMLGVALALTKSRQRVR
jgi:hypothetical protein